jgi:hypothetical protein
MFKKLGRILSAPVRVPMRKAKEKAMQMIVLALVRNGLKLLGLAGVFSDSQVSEAVGALMLLGGLAWTGFNTWREMQAKQLPAKP